MNTDIIKEKELQETYSWERSIFYADYSKVLGYYQAKACLDYMKDKNSLLDLACGDGNITNHFAKEIKRVEGLDASKVHLENARNNNPVLVFHESLIESFESDFKFKNVTMLNLLEHVEDPVSVLQKAASFLDTGGRLFVHVPNAEAINRKIAVKMGALLDLEELSPFDIKVAGHRRSYTLETLLRDINASGLKVIKTGGVFYKMLSMAQMNWFLENGLWSSGKFGWGREGDKSKDWMKEFCRGCYEIGIEYPRECNIVYAIIENG